MGDDTPRDRTGELRRMGFEMRHLGSVQMTTDTVSSGEVYFSSWEKVERRLWIDHAEGERNDGKV